MARQGTFEEIRREVRAQDEPDTPTSSLDGEEPNSQPLFGDWSEETMEWTQSQPPFNPWQERPWDQRVLDSPGPSISQRESFFLFFSIYLENGYES